MTRCNLVAGAVASGEPLTDAEREHLKGCPDCAALVALPSALARSSRGAEPGLGFSARMQVGARARIATRRRRRVTASLLGTVAAAAVIFFGVQRLQRDPHAAVASRPAASNRTASPEESARARAFLERTRFDRAMKPAGPWREVEADLLRDINDRAHHRTPRSAGEPR